MYTGDLNKDMAEGFIALINEKYPNSLPLRIRGKISLLEHYVGAIALMNHEDRAVEEGIAVANEVISMSRRIKVRNMRQYKSESIHLYETYAFTSIGSISANNLRDSPKALEYLGKALNVAQTHGEARDVARVEAQIAFVKSYADPSNKEEIEGQLEKLKSAYESEMKQNGESYPNTLTTGLTYAKALKEEHHGVKSEKLLSHLFEISK